MTEQHAFGTYPQSATATAAQHPEDALMARVNDPVVTAPRVSLLDELAAEAKKEIGRKVRYDISNRPGWSAEFETNIESDDFNRFRKAAQGKKKRPEDADPSIFSGMPLVEYNTGIYKHGELVEQENGEPLLFRSKEFVELFDGAYTQVDAVVKFVGSGHVIAMGNALYAEAGYGDEVVPVDPTDA